VSGLARDRAVQFRFPAPRERGTGTSLFHITAAASADADGELPARVATTIGQYNSLKTMSSDALRQRLNELRPHLHEAIDAVKAELDVVGDPPSSQISYSAPGQRPTVVPLAAAPHSDE